MFHRPVTGFHLVAFFAACNKCIAMALPSKGQPNMFVSGTEKSFVAIRVFRCFTSCYPGQAAFENGYINGQSYDFTMICLPLIVK
jgi:hypothetical protein